MVAIEHGAVVHPGEIIRCFLSGYRENIGGDVLMRKFEQLIEDAPIEARQIASVILNSTSVAFTNRLRAKARLVLSQAPQNLFFGASMITTLKLLRPGDWLQMTFREENAFDLWNIVPMADKKILRVTPSKAVLLEVVKQGDWSRLPSRTIYVKPNPKSFIAKDFAQSIEHLLEGVAIMSPGTRFFY